MTQTQTILTSWTTAADKRRRSDELILPSVPVKNTNNDSPDKDCCYFAGCRKCGGSGTRK